MINYNLKEMLHLFKENDLLFNIYEFLFLFFLCIIYLFFDCGVQFITLVGPRQCLLLAKDPNQFFWKPYIP